MDRQTNRDWYDPWFNRGGWILDHLQDLNLEPNEALVMIVINFLNDTDQKIPYEVLAEKCHMDVEDIDEAITGLSAKGYLQFNTRSSAAKRFDLSVLMESPISSATVLDQSLFTEFQEEFGRTFSAPELDRILSMQEKYGEKMVRLALAEAAVYEKRNLNYIENILTSWSEKGLSAEDVEAGRR